VQAPARITSIPIWHELLRTTAQLQTSFVVYVNRVGYEDGLNFGGGSIALDPFGRTLASFAAADGRGHRRGARRRGAPPRARRLSAAS